MASLGVFNDLCKVVTKHVPQVIFLSKTKCDVSTMEFIKCRLNFDGYFGKFERNEWRFMCYVAG